MAAGDAIALAYELGRTHDEAFREEESAELCDKLRQLATDSHKYRAKKDRKQQRSSFRDILHFIEVSINGFASGNNFFKFPYKSCVSTISDCLSVCQSIGAYIVN